VFSVWSIRRLNNEDQLPLWVDLERSLRSPETAARRVAGWCEMAASLGVKSVSPSRVKVERVSAGSQSVESCRSW
jgi:hypothetical protein